MMALILQQMRLLIIHQSGEFPINWWADEPHQPGSVIMQDAAVTSTTCRACLSKNTTKKRAHVEHVCKWDYTLNIFKVLYFFLFAK